MQPATTGVIRELERERHERTMMEQRLTHEIRLLTIRMDAASRSRTSAPTRAEVFPPVQRADEDLIRAHVGLQIARFEGRILKGVMVACMAVSVLIPFVIAAIRTR